MAWHVRRTTRARVTGVEVELWDLTGDGAPLSPELDWQGKVANRWATWCVEHGELCTHPTLALARDWMAGPDGWCEGCRQIVVARLPRSSQ